MLALTSEVMPCCQLAWLNSLKCVSMRARLVSNNPSQHTHNIHVIASSTTTTFSSEDLADYFTDIATDSTYDQALTNDSLVKSIPLTKSFVCCLLIDYSKAFDSINHSILFQKLQSLDLLPSITLWICNFLNGRTQSVSCGGVLSNWKFITASIIQGSGIGPSLFIIYSKDLKPLSVHNTI